MKDLLKVSLILLLSIALPTVAGAALYHYVDDRGIKHYTNVPEDGRLRMIDRPHRRGGTTEEQQPRTISRRSNMPLARSGGAGSATNSDQLPRSIAPRSSSTCGTYVLAPDELFEKVKDSVVVVNVLDKKGKNAGQGSGVVLPSGRIATNFHVVKGGASFLVVQYKRQTKGTIHAANKDMDMCLLNVREAIGKPVELGSASTLKIGKTVYAVGAPQGLELSLSNGIVSQLRGGPPPIIQTTAAISPGSSGGGLFDEGGCLVGLTTLHMKDGQNLNFAMPVDWLGAVAPAERKPQAGILPAAVHTEGAGFEWRNLNQEAFRLREAGEYDRALVIAQKALDLARQNAGEHHPDVAMSLNNLAGLYQDKGDYAKAEPLFKHSLAIYEEVLGPEHPDVAVSLDNLAELCRATSRPSEAYIFQRRAASIRAIKR